MAASAITTVTDIVLEPAYITSPDPINYILSRLEINVDGITAVEVATRGQRDNAAWGACRKGRLTASNFGVVLRHQASRSRGKPSKSLMKRVLCEYDLAGMKAIQWWINHESEAINTYQTAKDCEVKPSGIWLDRSGCLGGSPDGIVDDELIVEVKCPYSIRDKPVTTAIAEGHFYLKKNIDDDIELDTNTDLGMQYYHQMQGNMHLSGRSKCDFVSWTPLEMVIVQVEKDPAWTEKFKLLQQFHRDHILPVFVSGGL